MAVLGYTKGDILRYIFLPQVLPRLRTLFRSGFSYLAFFMAQVFRAGNIIPPQHPYLNSAYVGTYTLIDVLTLASSQMVFDRKHIDQVIFFFTILAGLVLLIIQFFLLLLSLFISNAQAAAEVPKNYSDFLITKKTDYDIAFQLMDRVFGVPGLFPVKVPTAGNAFHTALHGLLQFYSLGLLVVAVIILLYFIAAILAETAETGTPFGKRYKHVWAPIRLVVALGLLIPMGFGLNAAQWITLYAAKFGSGFATNGWLLFTETLGEKYTALGDEEKLIHTPERPDVGMLVTFMYTARVCKEATQQRHKIPIYAWLIKGPAEATGTALSETSYEGARKYFNDTDNITIRFGERNPDIHQNQKGFVYPFCGDLILPTANTDKPGAKIINQYYYELISKLWTEDIAGMDEYAKNEAWCTSSQKSLRDKCKGKTPSDFAQKVLDEINAELDDIIEKSVKEQKDAAIKKHTGEEGALEQAKQYGWAGAGLYYNVIAELNGAIASSLYNAPYPLQWPAVLAFAENEGKQENQAAGDARNMDNTLASGRGINWTYLGDEEVYSAIRAGQGYWRQHLTATKSDNIIIDVINLVLGTDALFNMCKNADVHPLAQLAGVGGGLVEQAIRNLGSAAFFSVIGIGASSASGVLGAAAGAFSSFFVTFAMIGLMIGFLMAYVIPFMPFLYFFFAVTGWVKAIFEAMVGVPLWALAHLRIDGEGLPGDAAVGGYFLILEIFLRPILIIFGLIAAVSIFAAMVKVLNEIFFLVVSNIGGFDKSGIDLCGKGGTGATPPVGSAEYYRGPIDQFFFTVVYAIVVYLIGTSCFKMIDMVPNKVLRWMGANVNSFGDVQKDAGEGLLNKLSVGGYAMTSQLQGAFSGAGQAAKSGFGLVGKMMKSEE